MKILSRTGAVLFEDVNRSIRATLEAAVTARADLSGANLSEADLSEADLRRADLRRADLRGADLRRADLSGADLDFSCLPLWCGSFDMKINNRLLYQLCYHICKLDGNTEDFRAVKTVLTTYANKFHRVGECGRI